MAKVIVNFEKLRKVKDSLPSGSMQQIADELGVSVEAVRSYFGGKAEDGTGFHIEPGPNGGYVMLDDTRILEVALRLQWLNQI